MGFTNKNYYLLINPLLLFIQKWRQLNIPCQFSDTAFIPTSEKLRQLYQVVCQHCKHFLLIISKCH